MKKLKLVDAIEIAEKLEKIAESTAIEPHIRVSMFEEEAEQIINGKQDETFETLFDLLKIYEIATGINSKIDAVAASTGLLAMENERKVAEKWLKNIKSFLDEMNSEAVQEIETLTSIDDAKARKINFSALSIEQTRDLKIRISDGEDSLISLRKKAEFIKKVESIEISDEEIELITKYLPDYKFV